MQRLKECRGGREYDSAFGQRMRGTGLYADIIHKRFELARKRLRYDDVPILDNTLFNSQSTAQMTLFWTIMPLNALAVVHEPIVSEDSS